MLFGVACSGHTAGQVVDERLVAADASDIEGSAAAKVGAYTGACALRETLGLCSGGSDVCQKGNDGERAHFDSKDADDADALAGERSDVKVERLRPVVVRVEGKGRFKGQPRAGVCVEKKSMSALSVEISN